MLISPSVVLLSNGRRQSIAQNTQLVSWLSAAARALGGDSRYSIRYAYVEFENVVAPGDPVSVPTVDPYDPAEGRDYYTGLTGVRDYVRVPVLGTPIYSASAVYAAYFPPGDGNRLQITAAASAGVGENGATFGDASNSKVCGVAIVAAPGGDDSSQDIVLARTYYAADSQQLLLPGSPIEIIWQAQLLLPSDL